VTTLSVGGGIAGHPCIAVEKRHHGASAPALNRRHPLISSLQSRTRRKPGRTRREGAATKRRTILIVIRQNQHGGHNEQQPGSE
jgi:hypothetical protein